MLSDGMPFNRFMDWRYRCSRWELWQYILRMESVLLRELNARIFPVAGIYVMRILDNNMIIMIPTSNVDNVVLRDPV